MCYACDIFNGSSGYKSWLMCLSRSDILVRSYLQRLNSFNQFVEVKTLMVLNEH